MTTPRFPNTGVRGGAVSQVSKNGKIDGQKTPGKGCTITPNIMGYRGLPAGIRTWPYYIDPATSAVMKAAFRANFDAINSDQLERGSDFRFQETSINDAHLFISPPGGSAPPLSKTDLATTHVHGNRDGSIRTTWTVVIDAPLSADLADTLAAHEIEHAVGADDDYGIDHGISTEPDWNYPTVMYYAPPAIAGQKMDACTLAVIDANVNREK